MKNDTYIALIIIIVLVITSIFLLTSCFKSNPTEPPKQDIFIVEYLLPENGGYYEYGERKQYIRAGEDGATVSVAPYEGYIFIKWSDDILTPARNETNVQNNLTLYPIFAKQNYTVSYNADNGGYISGDTLQEIEYGNNSSIITAIPNDGFLFAGWSDGLLLASRQENIIKSDINVTATFVKNNKILTYNSDVPKTSSQSILLTHGELTNIQFYIPHRDGYIFDGWYLDPEFNIKITDKDGNYFYGNNIFYESDNILYPKWITDTYIPFKILMVFIEETSGTLPNKLGDDIKFEYKMSLDERYLYKKIPKEIDTYLNTWFENITNFEVDMYFTTQPIDEKAYDYYEPGWPDIPMKSNSHFIFANSIPELFPILHNYRSVITTGCMNDFSNSLHNSSGLADEKYAYIAMDKFFEYHINNNEPVENYLYPNSISWNTLIELYLHEFTHTVETIVTVDYDLHKIESYYAKQNIYGLEPIKLFLLKQVIIDDQKYGIDENFWIGNINISVNYRPSFFGGLDNGKIIINNGLEQNTTSNSYGALIPYGSTISVEAIAFDGYRFIKWSDGITTPIRYDVNVISKIQVFAIFEKYS
ncbi:MAG: InlB B-repeat-containing protein [Clostridia bacterium]|nr:InlB B-repeat-containing protein [Clostridia bacterium]